MRIDGLTEVIAHIGYPTYSFKAPLIYNPYFVAHDINAVVVPMGCRSENFDDFFRAISQLVNLRGMLITMPHKTSVVSLLDDISPAVAIAGSCNAVKRLADGRLVGDMFDGEGFVRGLQQKGIDCKGMRVLMIGAGGVGSAIAASLAARGIRELALVDPNTQQRDALIQRLQTHAPDTHFGLGSNNPSGYDLIINASPLGMQTSDALPIETELLAANMVVGDVILSQRMTPLLTQAQQRGCLIQVGEDMLFEQIPAYLEFFNFPVVDAQTLKKLARLETSV